DSERDVVVHRREGVALRAGGGLPARRLAALRALRALPAAAGSAAPAAARVAAFFVATEAAAPASAVTRAEPPNARGDELGGVAVQAFRGLPLAGLQPALDVGRPRLPEVLPGGLGEAIVEDPAVPFGFPAFLAAGLVLPVAG